MAYDEGLAQRVREMLSHRPDLTEKKMFGGLCFLLGGNMCCGISGDDLMLRVGPDAYEEVLAKEHAREMDFTGRALRGMVFVGPPGLSTDSALAGWLAPAVEFAGGLPTK
ncbi:MAG: TfoX/Sxy family protein [Gemmatimonadetes bacterium]|nr:TfoX/Sxy family protein [Gemmatimonadota bacterium]